MLTWIAALALAQDPMQEIEELRREIELLNGINSLQLTKEQIEKIVPLAKDAKKKTDELVASNQETFDAVKAAMTRMRDALEKGEPPSPEQQRELGELQRGMGDLYRQFQEINERTSSQLKSILNEKQIRALSQMGRPDPTRPMREQLGRFLDQLREDPNLELNEELLGRMREGIQRLAGPLRLKEEDLDAEFERISNIIEETFEASGEDLAKKRDEYVSRVFDEGKIGEALKKFGPPPEESSRRIAQQLLNPKVIQILEKRLGK